MGAFDLLLLASENETINKHAPKNDRKPEVIESFNGLQAGRLSCFSFCHQFNRQFIQVSKSSDEDMQDSIMVLAEQASKITPIKKLDFNVSVLPSFPLPPLIACSICSDRGPIRSLG